MSDNSQRLEENYILGNMAGAIKTTATSILLYLSDAYFWAVKDHFAEFWPPLLAVSGSFPVASWEKTLLHCSSACREQVCQLLRERAEYAEHPMLQTAERLEAALKAEDTKRISEILKTLPLSSFQAVVREDVKGASEETMRRLLQTLDIAAYLKMNYALNHRTDVYQWLKEVYPAIGNCTQQEWSYRNDQAVRLRNRLDGHLVVEDLQKLDPAEWKQKCDIWMEICGLLRNEKMAKAYETLRWAVTRSTKLASYVMIAVAHLAEVSGVTAESVETILQESNFEVHDGQVFCESESVALQAIRMYVNRRHTDKILVEQQKKIDQLLKNQPQLSALEAETQALRTMLETKVPKLRFLRQYERGVMSPAQLRELAETHLIVADGSVLRSKAGREFLCKDLMPHLKQLSKVGNQAALVVEATARYHIYQDREACRRDGISGSEAQAAYVVMEDGLRKAYNVLRYVSTPNPVLTDEEALVEYIRTLGMKRVCVLTYGASPLAKMLGKDTDPLCVVARLMRVPRGNQMAGGSGFGCMIFEHMLPFAIGAEDAKLMEHMQKKFHQGKKEEAGSVTDEEYLKRAMAMPLASEEAALRKQEQLAKEAEAQHELKQAIEEHAKKKQEKPKTSFAADPDMRKLNNTLLPLERMVQPGDVLRTSNGGSVRIMEPLMEKSVINNGAEQVAEGGEGTLYVTDVPGQVAKLYHREQLTQGRKEKLEAMIETRVKISGVCWPSTALYRNDQFVGYLMPQAPKGARPLGLSVFQLAKEAVQKGDMSGWDRMSLVQVAKAIANAMHALHSKNILMGDVNAANFLILPEEGRDVSGDEGANKKSKAGKKMSVYLVDCDSYQFDGYPCPVGTEVYTHPGTKERLGIQGPLQFGTFLRTKEEEQYALAILLFQILMLGQSPFSNKAGLSFTEAMKQKVFPYTLEEVDDVPEGDAWMIWKNLTKHVQTAFLEVFKEWKPIAADEWVRYLEGYANAIKKFNFSRELIPTKYVEYNKENPVFVDLVCINCGKEFNKHKKWVENRKAEAIRLHREPRYFCGVCTGFLETNRTIPMDLICELCGKTFEGTREQGYLNHKLGERLLCQDCLNPTVYCMVCGAPYMTTRWKLENHSTHQCEHCYKLKNDHLLYVQCEECGSYENMTKGRIFHARIKKEPLLCGSCLRRRRYV